MVKIENKYQRLAFRGESQLSCVLIGCGIGLLFGLCISNIFSAGTVNSNVDGCICARDLSNSVHSALSTDPTSTGIDPAAAAAAAAAVATDLSSAKRSFKEIAIESKSDKYSVHHYEIYYESWLAPYRSVPDMKLLELGARDGKSMKLWEQYFDNAKVVVGLAYAFFTHGLEEKTQDFAKVQIIRGDQSKKETMDKLKKLGPWHIIIDDASHLPPHQIYSLFSLWNSVAPGGLYVIEDLETNYWYHNRSIYGYHVDHTGIGAPADKSAITKIEQIQQVLMRHQVGVKRMSVMPGDDDICSVEWGMNLVALRKCPANVTKPNFLQPGRRYDKKAMAAWLKEAISTNPVL